MVDLAYNFTLNRRGHQVWYTPCAEVIHYGSRSIGQNPEGALRDETEAFIVFNEAYGYFRQDWLSKMLVRVALKARLHIRLLEQHFRGDQGVAKGPVGVYARDVSAALPLRNLDVVEQTPRNYEAPADIFQ